MPLALDTNYFKPDEHSYEEILVFIRRLSEYVKYYKRDGTSDNNWAGFFSKDESFVYASIAVTEQRLPLEEMESCKESREGLAKLFDIVYSILYDTDSWYKASPETSQLLTEISTQIENNLLGLKSDIDSYNTLFISNSLLDSGGNIFYSFDPRDELGIKIDTSLLFETFEPVTGKYYTSNLLSGLATEEEKIKRAIEAISEIFQMVYRSYCFIIEKAKTYFEKSFSATDIHQPHIGLLFTFIKLFKCSQDNLNEFTKRHLDFYYKEILKLKNKSETPDKANLIFEPAKNVDEHLIAKGTEFKAGKDSSGIDLIYTLNEEFVLNKAKVSPIKNLYVDKDNDSRIYISQFANSKDGNGKEIDTEPASWKTFGHSDSSTDYPAMTQAVIGFAVSSPILLLSEGKRIIALSLLNSNSQMISLDSSIDSYLKAEITGPKGWFEITEIVVSNNKLTLTIPSDSSSTVKYDSKLHGTGYETDYPIVKLSLKTENETETDSEIYGYDYLSSITFSSIKIETDVTGVKNLILQNELGVLKPEKPFQPFGPIPYLGSVFYIGSNEVFTKKLTELKLYFDWAKLPSSFTEYYKDYFDSENILSGQVMMRQRVKLATEQMGALEEIQSFSSTNLSFTAVVSQLDKPNEWKSLTEEIALFPETNILDIPVSSDLKRNYSQETFTAYSTAIGSGFINLELTGYDSTDEFKAFGHNVYSKIYTEKIINKLTDSTINLPNEPYTPLLNSLTLDYKSEEVIIFDSTKPEQFYHIYPFGVKKIESPSGLIPQFQNEGELYIGISDIVPPQNLSLLIQVAEGSENPSVDTPEVGWSYLYNEEWIELDSAYILKDDTDGLIKSGIITLSIPEEISSSSTLMNSEIFWLRASVTKDSTGVCDAISIIAQASSVTYTNNGNCSDHLMYPLPAESIKKFKVKDASVKSVSQPFSSFSGKPVETNENFYVRISERLRHKDRAIQKWDYERLVLEEFSDIYKIICLQHTGVEKSEKIILHEDCPGHVTVAVVPDIRNRNAVDPYKPLVSVGKIDDIKEFLEEKISPFICLDVVNAIYETIYIKATVYLQFGYDAGLYRDQLEQDLIKFLSPWMYDDAAEIQFGGRIHKSEIIDYIDELAYVDFVERLIMLQDGVPVDFASAKTSISILASNSEHELTMIAKDTKDERINSYCKEH